MDELDDAAIIVEAKYSVNITKSRNKICLSLHYNTDNRFLYVNGVKIYQFKANLSEIKSYLLCLRNMSKYFTVDNIKKARLNGKVCNFLLVMSLLM